MKRIEKFLKRLNREERVRVQKCVEKIVSGSWDNFDIKKLKGYSKVYRARTGDIRIVFIFENKNTRIIMIERRNEGTYRDL